MKTKALILILTMSLLALKVAGQCDLAKVVGGAGTICSGSSTIITVAASDATASYQLRDGITSVGSAVSGNGGLISLPTGTLTSSTTFNVFVTGTVPVCTGQLTQTAAINVDPVTLAGSVTGGTTICSGSTSGLLTLGSYTGTIVRWESSPNGTSSWSTIANNLATYTSGTLTSTTYFRAVVQSGVCSEANSTSTTMTVNPILTASVSIVASANPSCTGSPVTFTATPTNGGSTPAYQWNVNTVDVGTNSNTYTYTPVTGDIIKVVMTSNATPCLAGSPATSGNITMTVNALPIPTLISSAAGNKSCVGASVTFTAGGAGSGTYQFFSNGVSQGAPSTTNTYSTTTLTDGQTVTVTVVDGNSCTASHPGISTTVYAYPVITAIMASAGTGEAYSIVPLNGTDGTVPAGTTYSWVTGLPFSANLTIVSGSTGTDQASISGNMTHSKNSSREGNFTVTPKNLLCTGAPFNLKMTILSKASITDKLTSICNGGTFTISPVVGEGVDIVPAGTTYSWPLPVASGISGLAAGPAGSLDISGTLTNSTSLPIDVVYTVTPKTGSLNGAAFTVTVTVRPTAVVNQPANQIKCSGQATTAIVFGGVANSYTWTNNNTSIGLAASGTTDISSFTATNTGIIPVTSTITVTPYYDGCPGSNKTFTITVNPLPTLSGVSQNAQICSELTATINLTGLLASSTSTIAYSINGVAQTAVTNVVANGSGAASFVTVSLPAVNNGKTLQITGITNQGTGCSATFAQNTLLIVNTATLPTLTGDLTPCINSTVTYSTQSGMNNNSYVWTFPVGGTYTGGGTNTNNNTITVTWTALGSYDIGVNFTNSSGCTATSPTTISAVVSALPTPVITGPTLACINSSGNVYSTLAGMSGYDWEISGGSITSGGDNSSFVVVTWTSPGPGSITVNYANASGCTASSPTNYAVTVHPLPVVITANTASTCNGTSPSISLSASVASTFTWTVGAISGSISGATSGSGSIIIQILGNASNSSAGTVEYLVTPTSTTGSCAGNPYSIIVTVYPSPVVTNSGTTTICNGTGPNITLTSSVPGSFTWTVGTIAGGITGAAAGFGNTINQVLTNPSNTTPGTVQYLITPTSTTGTCIGNTYSIVVTVNPTPVVTSAPAVGTCSNTGPNILLTASIPSSFSWTVGAITGIISGASPGSGNTINQVLSNPSNTFIGTAEYLVTPVSITGTCAGVPYSIIVTVNPLPLPALAGPLSVRVTSTGNLYTTDAGMSNYIWTVSPGGSVTAGGTSASSNVTVTWNNTGSQSISVSYSNTSSCTAAAPTIQNVTVNPIPSVSNVQISGTPAIGNTLTGSYIYTDGCGGINVSTLRWLKNGITPVGGTTITYVVQPLDLNCTITFEVTPVSTVGPPNTGSAVNSSPTLPVEDFSEIPVADQICIEGVRSAGSILKGKYKYTHSKPEGASIRKWFIDGVYTATGSTYTLLSTDIDAGEVITFEVTPVSSNIVPVSGVAVTSNELAKMPLWPVDYSVSGTSVPLSATPSGGIFSGPGVTNGDFSPASVGIGGPYNIQYQLIIVNSATTCSQQLTKAVNVVANTTELTNFKLVYCNDENPSVITITGVPPGATSLGFTCTDGDAIVSATALTVTIDPRNMNPGTNIDVLYFSYRDILFNIYSISKSFIIDKVGTNIQILNLDAEYCTDAPKAPITITGATPAGGTALWTGTVLSDLTATSASVDVTLGIPGQTYPLSYQYITPLGCRSAILTRSVKVNPLPNTAFTLNPFYNYDGPEVDLIPVQSPGTFSGNGVVSNNKLLPLQAGLGEHTINYYIRDVKGCDDSRNIKTTIKKAQGIITGIPAVICYQHITYNVNVTGLPSGYLVNSFVNTRNSIIHAPGSTSASYNVPAAGEGLDTLTFSYKLDAVDYRISAIVNIDSLGLVDFTNLFPGDKICDNIAPFKLNATPTGGVFSGPVAGNFLDPEQTAGSYGVTYIYTNQKTACSISKTIPIEIIKAPVVSFTPKDVCIESFSDLTYFANKTKSSDKVNSWLWTFAEIGAAPDTVREPGFLYRTGGIHAISLRAITVSGCVVTKDSSINLGTRPTGDFTWKNDCYASGTNLKLYDATGTDLTITSRTWNFNNGSFISSALNPEYPMPDTGIVNVKYIVRTNYANCADTIVKNIYLRPTFKLAPDVYYSENFETGKNGWGKDETDITTSWQFGKPNGKVINSAYSGTGAWFTSYDTLSPPRESSSVISPCFDFTDIQRPMISIEAIKRFEKNRNGAALQYFAEGDTEWRYVGTLDDGIEWYNSTLISGEPGGEKIGWTTLGDVGEKEYVQSSHALDELQGRKNVKFRIAYGSDGSNAVGEGIAFDDVRVGERSRKVLLEHFTNTGSKSGSEATKIVDDILPRRKNDVINIQYHTNFPDNDLFYTANQGDASARIFSYGLSRVPYTMIDGGNQLMYASLADYKSAQTDLDTNDLSRRSLLDTRFEIEVAGAEASGVLTVKSKITSTVSGSFDNLVLYLVVTEKKNSTTETGALGEKTFFNVFRKFVPDAGGIELRKTWTKGESVVIPDQTWAIPGNLGKSEIEVIAFIQNSQTKEVCQVSSDLLTTAKSEISNSPNKALAGTEDLSNATATSFGLYPNPADERLTIEFNNRLSADAEVRIFDLQGVIKATYKVASGESGLFIEDLSLKAGIYFVRVTAGTVDLGFKKLIVTGE